MKILIIGAAGMIGARLAAALAEQKSLGGQAIESLVLADMTAPAIPAGAPAARQSLALDISAPGAAQTLVAGKPDLIFHLAAIVSGEAEADFEKGYRINLDASRALFDAVRLLQGTPGDWRPRLVFASSIAVFGAPFPDQIGDDFHTTPLSSYGTQKAITELLLNDYTRRGFMDGISIRLPTICVRPGKPNKAASSFFSGILREPLAGQDAVLPVPDDIRHWFASPRAAIGFLLHAATMDLSKLGPRRALNMPGLSATVAEEIEALRRSAGDEAVARIKRTPDATIMRIVEGWPRDFDAARATALGFTAESSMDEIVAAHRADEGV